MTGQTNVDSKSSAEKQEPRDQTFGKVTTRNKVESETKVRVKFRACEFCMLLSLRTIPRILTN